MECHICGKKLQHTKNNDGDISRCSCGYVSWQHAGESDERSSFSLVSILSKLFGFLQRRPLAILSQEDGSRPRKRILPQEASHLTLSTLTPEHEPLRVESSPESFVLEESLSRWDAQAVVDFAETVVFEEESHGSDPLFLETTRASGTEDSMEWGTPDAEAQAFLDQFRQPKNTNLRIIPEEVH